MVSEVIDRKLGANYSLTPSQLEQLLTLYVPNRWPVMIWGPPGVGKSWTVQRVAATLGYEFIDIRALLLDPVDLHGIPGERDGRTVFLPPEFLPPTDSTGNHLLCIEEISSAPQSVQTALYQLVLDGKLGEYKLPPGAAVVACGNREEDRGAFFDMPPALADRFWCHVDVEVTARTWGEWAVAQNLSPEVIFFLYMRPELIHAYDPESSEMAFPTPRSWHQSCSILEQFRSIAQASGNNGAEPMDPAIERAAYRGKLGEGTAVEFMAFLKVWKSLPSPEYVLRNPLHCDIPSETSALLALCGSLYRAANEDNMENLTVFGRRLRPELGEYLIGQCVKRDPLLQHTYAWVKWISEIK